MKLKLIVFVLSLLSCMKEDVDLIIKNATLYNSDGSKKIENTIIVQHGMIVELGDESHLGRFQSTNTVDLENKLLIPGFNDAHLHFMGASITMTQLDLTPFSTKSETIEALKAYAKDKKKGEWIVGRGWNHELWKEKKWPTASDLDKLFPENPIYLQRVDGHSGWVNSLALNLAGIDKSFKDPAGGKILKDRKGNPNGILVDAATQYIENIIPKAKQEQKLEAAKKTQDYLLKYGLTSITDISNKSNFDVYKALYNKDELKIRFHFIPDISESFPDFKSPNDKYLNVIYSKVYSDGSLGSRSAWLKKDYADKKGERGIPMIKENELEEKIRFLKDNGLQPAIHAIGDQANFLLLNTFSNYLKVNNDKKLRFRIEHVQILDSNDLDLFYNGQVIASMQPKHCISDMYMAQDRLEKSRLQYAYAWRTMLDRNIPLAFGTDWPVEPVNPFLGLYAAVTRQDLNDTELKNAWIPSQKISVAEAINAYTMGSAYAEFTEAFKGKIEKDFLADFIVIDRNLYEVNPIEIKDASVLMTFVDGKLLYKK
jgi:predicted amidohydrolase YtcJ